MIDKYKRSIDYARISVIDKCNLNCIYCTTKENINFLPERDTISDSEIIILCKALAQLGIKNIKITGGEPLIRKGIVDLIANIKNIDGIENITLTTNGIILDKYIASLKNAGLDSINISLDALDNDLFKSITGHDKINELLKNIEMALEYNFSSIKINCVLLNDLNHSEYVNIASLAKHKNIFVRFIEVMPIGEGKSQGFISSEMIKIELEKEFGKFEGITRTLGNGPALYYNVPNFIGKIGFISAISNQFCHKCNRIRITSDGSIKSCLYYKKNSNIKHLLNENNFEKLKDTLYNIVYEKEKSHDFANTDESKNADIENMSDIGG